VLFLVCCLLFVAAGDDDDDDSLPVMINDSSPCRRSAAFCSFVSCDRVLRSSSRVFRIPLTFHFFYSITVLYKKYKYLYGIIDDPGLRGGFRFQVVVSGSVVALANAPLWPSLVMVTMDGRASVLELCLGLGLSRFAHFRTTVQSVSRQ
jgi:hypothetical protein